LTCTLSRHTITFVEKVKKRRSVKVALAILIVVGTVLVLLVIWMRDRPEMSFGFLDVSTKVEAELLGLGFKNVMLGNQKSNSRQYLLSNNSSAERFSVSILDKQRLSSYSTPKSSGYSSPARHEYHWRDGWVSIEVTRRRLRYWPPKYLLRRLQMKLRRAAGKPSPKKS